MTSYARRLRRCRALARRWSTRERSGRRRAESRSARSGCTRGRARRGRRRRSLENSASTTIGAAPQAVPRASVATRTFVRPSTHSPGRFLRRSSSDAPGQAASSSANSALGSYGLSKGASASGHEPVERRDLLPRPLHGNALAWLGARRLTQPRRRAAPERRDAFGGPAPFFVFLGDAWARMGHAIGWCSPAGGASPRGREHTRSKHARQNVPTRILMPGRRVSMPPVHHRPGSAAGGYAASRNNQVGGDP